MKTTKADIEEPSIMYKVPGQISDSEILNFLHTNEVNWKYINAIKQLTGFNDDIIAAWLNVSVRTFRSYRQPENKYKENIKEQIILLLSLIKHGIRVFGSASAFNKWLNEENFYFDSKIPNSLLNTVTGIRFVDDTLTTMEYGDNV